MKRFIGAALVAVVVAGCTPPKPQNAPETLAIGEAPSCSCESQCSAMWADAASRVADLSGMRVRLSTDAIIETFVAVNASTLTGAARKVPLGKGKFAFESSFEPWARTASLAALSNNARALFNSGLRLTAQTAACPG